MPSAKVKLKLLFYTFFTSSLLLCLLFLLAFLITSSAVWRYWYYCYCSWWYCCSLTVFLALLCAFFNVHMFWWDFLIRSFPRSFKLYYCPFLVRHLFGFMDVYLNWRFLSCVGCAGYLFEIFKLLLWGFFLPHYWKNSLII